MGLKHYEIRCCLLDQLHLHNHRINLIFLSGRNLKVCVVEKNTVGSATSSWSTKLIHGGLRYLENYEFRLVRESLKEREVIKKIASKITTP